MRNCKTLIRLLAAGAGLSLLLASCVRESAQEQDLVGQPICFDAWTVDADPETKTAFSGIVTDGIERINWEVDDRIRVACREVSWPAAQRYDYYLAPDYNDGKLSYATLNPHGSAHGLLWGTGSHTFYALYPSPTGSETSFTMEEGYAMARVTLPADQSYETARTTDAGGRYYGNMKLAYMLAANVLEPTSDRVVLAFFPIVTTFYVTITNTTGAGMTLRRVELTSSDSVMQGTYEAVITSVSPLAEGNLPTTTTPNFTEMYTSYTSYTSMSNSVYATFDGLFVAPGNSVTVALFAVPFGTTGSNITNVTLSVTSDETGTVSRLLTEGSPAVPSKFAAGKKHNVTNIELPATTYDISVDKTLIEYDGTRTGGPDQTFHVTSTRTVGTGVGRPSYAAAWKTQIKVSDTGNDLVDWVDMTAENRPSWMSTYPLTSEEVAGIPSSGTDAGRAEICRDVSEPPVQSHIDHLKEGVIYDTDGVTPVDNSTADKAVDLSKYDFVGRRMEADRYTANTYVISSPGWYKFPCVYGNAIENGSQVKNTYTGNPTILGAAGHLDDFEKAYSIALGADINSAWMENTDCTSPTLKWWKFTQWDNGENTLDSSLSGNLGVITSISAIDGEDHKFIRFYVDPNKIRAGCASIFIQNASFYTWNWMIWITDQNMAPINVTNSSSGAGVNDNYDVLPVNLGWTDNTKGLHHPPSQAMIRFVNIEGGTERCVSGEMTILQSGYDDISTSGWQPYYQWGRKDAFIPNLFSFDVSFPLLHNVMQHPDVMYSDHMLGSSTYDWSYNNYNNLWDSQWKEYGTVGEALPNMKTVYDPSPRKFCAPPENAWKDFTKPATFTQGYLFKPGLFFPASGYLSYLDGTLMDPGKGYYWTTHAIDNATNRISYALKFDETGVTIPQNGNTHHRANAYSIRPVRYQ